MPYTKTNFINGAAPALSAEELNKMGQGVQDAFNTADLVSYDLYELWLELYYKGYIAQVDAANAKAIMFDGFSDANNIQSKTAYLDTTNKRIQAGLSGKTGMTSTYSYEALNYNGNTASQFFKAVGSMSSFQVYLSYNQLNGYDFSVDMYVNGVYKGGGLFTNGFTPGWQTITLNSTPTLSDTDQCEIRLTYSDTDPSASPYQQWWYYDNISIGNCYRTYNGANRTGNYCFTIGGGAVLAEYATSSSMTSKNKNLPFAPKKITLYLSAQGNTVTPTLNISGTVYSLTQTSVRADSKFGSYTEYIYELSLPNNVGISVSLILALANTTTSTPYIKRYGLIMS